MNIIILILIALHWLSSPDQFTDDYQRTHQAEIAQATSIYESHQYKETDDGGVVIEDGVNP